MDGPNGHWLGFLVLRLVGREDVVLVRRDTVVATIWYFWIWSNECSATIRLSALLCSKLYSTSSFAARCPQHSNVSRPHGPPRTMLDRRLAAAVDPYAIVPLSRPPLSSSSTNSRFSSINSNFRSNSSNNSNRNQNNNNNTLTISNPSNSAPRATRATSETRVVDTSSPVMRTLRSLLCRHVRSPIHSPGPARPPPHLSNLTDPPCPEARRRSLRSATTQASAWAAEPCSAPRASA
mmetsp:Transcript_3774/g.11666  ORF Transcript_3774/g.11666 Transcript_3774/m.11666 type:complete len:236 (-) Transcript_3774:358-1065(-)